MLNYAAAVAKIKTPKTYPNIPFLPSRYTELRKTVVYCCEPTNLPTVGRSQPWAASELADGDALVLHRVEQIGPRQLDVRGAHLIR